MELDTIICGDCLDVMREMEDGCVDVVVTSPPYWNQEAYSFWPTYEDYMRDVGKWVNECARISKAGRHCFWTIPDKLPWPMNENGTSERLYMPVYSDTERIAAESGLIPEFPIIWDKRGPDLNQRLYSHKMWGSYPYPVSIIHTPFSERICVWRKPGKHGLSQTDREDSKITVEQFNEWAVDMWSIRVSTDKEHPAPFSIEIPERILTLWSRKGDLIFDPFIGSGTTAVAALKLGRHFYGCDINPEYVKLANERIEKTRLEMSQTEMRL